MCVFTCEAEDFEGIARRERCSVCDELLWYPFLSWRNQATINICGGCACNIKNGLTADLIQLVAIKEVRSAGYPEFTLGRERIQDRQKRLADGNPLRDRSQ